MFWFVTFVTHGTRISERMRRYRIGPGVPVILDPVEQAAVAASVIDTCRAGRRGLVALNVLPDHVHLVVAVRDDKELPALVRRIKGAASMMIRRRRRIHGAFPIWAQKFNRRPIESDAALREICHYVYHNHQKHVSRWGDALVATWESRIRPIVEEECVSVEEAARMVELEG